MVLTTYPGNAASATVISIASANAGIGVAPASGTGAVMLTLGELTYGTVWGGSFSPMGSTTLAEGNIIYYNGTNWVVGTVQGGTGITVSNGATGPSISASASSAAASMFSSSSTFAVATTTANGTYLGLATASITPLVSGKVLLVFTATVVLPGSASGFQSIGLDLYYGTTGTPVNGGTVPGSGTAAGSAGWAVAQGTALSAEGLQFQVAVSAVVTLTPGTKYWIDAAAKGSAATSHNYGRVTVSAFELA